MPSYHSPTRVTSHRVEAVKLYCSRAGKLTEPKTIDLRFQNIYLLHVVGSSSTDTWSRDIVDTYVHILMSAFKLLLRF